MAHEVVPDVGQGPLVAEVAVMEDRRQPGLKFAGQELQLRSACNLVDHSPLGR